MFSIFRAVVERLKALFATSAALELETDFLARTPSTGRAAAPGCPV